MYGTALSAGANMHAEAHEYSSEGHKESRAPYMCRIENQIYNLHIVKSSAWSVANVTSCRVTEFLPTCYSSLRSRPHICWHCCLTCITVSSLVILYIPFAMHKCLRFSALRGPGFWRARSEIRVEAAVARFNYIPQGITVLWELGVLTRQDHPWEIQEILLSAHKAYTNLTKKN